MPGPPAIEAVCLFGQAASCVTGVHRHCQAIHLYLHIRGRGISCRRYRGEVIAYISCLIPHQNRSRNPGICPLAGIRIGPLPGPATIKAVGFFCQTALGIAGLYRHRQARYLYFHLGCCGIALYCHRSPVIIHIAGLITNLNRSRYPGICALAGIRIGPLPGPAAIKAVSFFCQATVCITGCYGHGQAACLSFHFGGCVILFHRHGDPVIIHRSVLVTHHNGSRHPSISFRFGALVRLLPGPAAIKAVSFLSQTCPRVNHLHRHRGSVDLGFHGNPAFCFLFCLRIRTFWLRQFFLFLFLFRIVRSFLEGFIRLRNACDLLIFFGFPGQKIFCFILHRQTDLRKRAVCLLTFPFRILVFLLLRLNRFRFA